MHNLNSNSSYDHHYDKQNINDSQHTQHINTFETNQKQRLSLQSKRNHHRPYFYTPTKSTSTRMPFAQPSQTIVKYQLESQILQLQKTINTHKFQISTLTQQIQFYSKLCQTNKQQLQAIQNSKDLLINQYNQQIQLSLTQRQHASQILNIIQYQLQQQINQQQQQIQSFRNNNNIIAIQLQNLLDQKEQLLKSIRQIDQSTKSIKQILDKQEDRIHQLRNIQRKFQIGIKQLQRLKNHNH